MPIDFIKPSGLPTAATVNTSSLLVVENGATVENATPEQIVTAGRPIATEAQALAGASNTTAMTPLTTKQALDNYPRPFLPLAGGTMSGALAFSRPAQAMITLNNTTNANASPTTIRESNAGDFAVVHGVDDAVALTVEPAGTTITNNIAAVTKEKGDARYLQLSNYLDVDRTFATVAEMVASTKNTVGDYVRTLGYLAAGDGGGNEYQIVAAATGTVDGGSYINLTGISGQAKGLFPGEVLKARQWGAPFSGSASAHINAMNTYATTAYGSPGEVVTLKFEGVFQLDDQVTLGPTGTGVTKVCNIDASGAIFEVIAGGDLESTAQITAFYIRNCIRSRIEFSQILCDHICGGITVENCSNTLFDGMHLHQFDWRALLVKGGQSTPAASNSSGAVFLKVTGAEWTSGETEFDTDSNFVSYGIVNESFDVRFAFAHIGWCRRAIVNYAGSTEYISCHPFNGNADTPENSVDRICFWNEAGGNVNVYNMYGDNGYVIDETGGVIIEGLEMLDLNTTMTHPYVRIRTDNGTMSGKMSGVRTDIGFYTGAFTADYSNEDTDFQNQVSGGGFDGGNDREIGRKRTRYIYGTPSPDFDVIKEGADTTTSIVYRHYPGAGNVAMRFRDSYAAFQDGTTDGGEVRVSATYQTGMSSGTGGQALMLYANDAERVRINSSGYVGIGTTNPLAPLDVNGDTMRLRTSKTPASASDTGSQGEFCWDANFFYVCTATDTWRRVAIAPW